MHTADKKVLITGASGFIGQRCISFFLKKGFEVHGIGRAKKPEFVENKVYWHTLDLLDFETAADFIQELKPTHLLNLAWYTAHGKFWQAAENILWVQAGLNLLTAFAQSGGKRFVGAGSCAEYDWKQGLLIEDMPCKPNSPFGVFKKSLYDISLTYSKLENLSFAWGRIFFVYGPNEPKGKLVNSVITSLLMNKPAQCSHGNQIRDFSHVDDVAAGLVALVDCDISGAVNIASGIPVSLKTIIYTIAKQLGKTDLIELGALKAAKDDPSTIVANIQKLKEEVGVTPSINLEAGIAETIKAVEQSFEKEIYA